MQTVDIPNNTNSYVTYMPPFDSDSSNFQCQGLNYMLCQHTSSQQTCCSTVNKVEQIKRVIALFYARFAVSANLGFIWGILFDLYSCSFLSIRAASELTVAPCSVNVLLLPHKAFDGKYICRPVTMLSLLPLLMCVGFCFHWPELDTNRVLLICSHHKEFK